MQLFPITIQTDGPVAIAVLHEEQNANQEGQQFVMVSSGDTDDTSAKAMFQQPIGNSSTSNQIGEQTEFSDNFQDQFHFYSLNIEIYMVYYFNLVGYYFYIEWMKAPEFVPRFKTIDSESCHRNSRSGGFHEASVSDVTFSPMEPGSQVIFPNLLIIILISYCQQLNALKFQEDKQCNADKRV
uniref:Uncharacterized protein n=1 Tax=Heterorhabditis bacteriophora TaxID=37862 RepID=A0A1I7W9W8_HETBA